MLLHCFLKSFKLHVVNKHNYNMHLTHEAPTWPAGYTVVIMKKKLFNCQIVVII